MTVPHAYYTARARNLALTGYQNLSRRRRTTEAARSRTHARQIKFMLTFCLIFAGVLGFGISQGWVAVPTDPATPKNQSTAEIRADTYFGQIRMPFKGDICQQYRFDNKTGTFTVESFVPCSDYATAPESASISTSNTRANALSAAFKFK